MTVALTEVAAPAILVACLAMVVASVWLPVVASRRWVPARWRALTASTGSAVVLALGAWFAVVSLSALS